MTDWTDRYDVMSAAGFTAALDEAIRRANPGNGQEQATNAVPSIDADYWASLMSDRRHQ